MEHSAQCTAGRRVVDPIADSCGVWQIAVEQTVDSGATACICDQYAERTLWQTAVVFWSEHYSRRNLRQVGRQLCNGPQREKFITITISKARHSCGMDSTVQ